MKLKVRRVDKDIVYSDEEIDLTGLVYIQLELDAGTVQINGTYDLLLLRSPDARFELRPRAPDSISVRLI